MKSSKVSSSHKLLLNEALNMFVKNMDTAFFKLVVVDEQGHIMQLHGNLSFPKKFTLATGQNWMMLEERIQWEATKHQGIVRLGNSVYNLIKYEEEDTVQLPYKVFLISSIDIDFPWLKLATSVINTNIGALLKGADLQKQMDDTHQFTFAMMNALKVGIISVSTTGEIRYANNQACQWINIRRRDLLKIPIKNLIPNWKNIYQLVSSGEKFLNEEIAITTPDRKAKFNVTVTPILNQEQVSLIGMVIAIRELENVYHLVNKYTGMQARFTFKDIIAKSQKMRKLVDFAKNISDSPSTILIEAESGTGKEVFAQSIHNASCRHDKGFVAINCAAISDNLIESELFGYDDGAFTGAKKGGHPGKFELANGGTLFLDEVGDMKPEVQVKLLRAIQEGAITRVGGEKTIPVDVRIIAATNKNLKEEVEKGHFRLDLFYRLSVIPLKIPALRERMEDLPSLIRFFLNKKSVRLQKQVPQIRYSTLQQFLDYDWPGNIRELENAIEQYVILDGDISFENLKKELESPQPVVQATNTPQTNDSDISLKLTTVKEMERELILKTIRHFNNNMTHAANSLGVSRNTLYLKIKKYKLPIT
ncbi:sigma 54-interacting transcriptional regulator [Carboxylicivirga mesophila]|uniref:Sigma 54-interacting transcriptional regulator n=1 Tax=Carboxylicivirga mesophila TaxID=1166478 RepID=A0ABS5KE00_9BACT|nr:sigma 54-interacting transcriptional regulator [Carboxylicivirga mesophila]MBS2213154.1 sigma 54-interacting transcriptional regulator [Carboxylicivirga mesophila]